MTPKESAKVIFGVLHDDWFSWTPEVVEAFSMAISALEKQEEDRWHSAAKEGGPKGNGEYLVTRGFIPYLDIVKKVGDPPIASDIVAWRPLPEPYTEEEA